MYTKPYICGFKRRTGPATIKPSCRCHDITWLGVGRYLKGVCLDPSHYGGDVKLVKLPDRCVLPIIQRMPQAEQCFLSATPGKVVALIRR